MIGRVELRGRRALLRRRARRFGDPDGLLLGDTAAAITGEARRGGRTGAYRSALDEPC